LWCSAPGTESYPIGRSRLGVPLPFVQGVVVTSFPRGATIEIEVEAEPEVQRPSVRRRRIPARSAQILSGTA
jgi:hypothetical protein